MNRLHIVLSFLASFTTLDLYCFDGASTQLALRDAHRMAFDFNLEVDRLVSRILPRV